MYLLTCCMCPSFSFSPWPSKSLYTPLHEIHALYFYGRFNRSSRKPVELSLLSALFSGFLSQQTLKAPLRTHKWSWNTLTVIYCTPQVGIKYFLLLLMKWLWFKFHCDMFRVLRRYKLHQSRGNHIVEIISQEGVENLWSLRQTVSVFATI